MGADAGKQAAAEAAVAHVEDGMRLGLGTGSTVAYFLDALAERGLDIAGVPTSERTARRCEELGIPLLDPGEVDELDLCVDGADELDHELSLTKGGGGALLREKIVATMSRDLLVIATTDKLVDRLGVSFPLPVEVVPFAQWPVTRRLESLGFSVDARESAAYRTDNGNMVLDCQIPTGIEDPAAMEATLALVPGIVESGLFIDLARRALLGTPEGGVQELTVSDA